MRTDELARCRALAACMLEGMALSQDVERLIGRCSTYREFRALLVLDGRLCVGLDRVLGRWKEAAPALNNVDAAPRDAPESFGQLGARLDGVERRLDSLHLAIDQLRLSVNEMHALVGPFGVPFPDGSMLVHTVFGVKYFIDPTDDVMAPQMVVYRQWESDLSRFMCNSIDRNTVFVDIGANFGYFSCLVASRIGRGGSGRVIAVEPNPKMLALLNRNIQVNWSMAPVEVHGCAIADAECELTFNLPAGRAANASLMAADAPLADGDQRITVQGRTLGAVVAGRRVDLMKVDVEGYEASVLAHLGSVLAASPHLCIVMEWSPAQMQAAGFQPMDIVALLKKFSLRAFRIPSSRFDDNETLARFAVDLDELPSLQYENLMLIQGR